MAEKKVKKIDNTGKHGYWVHKRKESESSVTGYFILPECSCGLCGYVSSFEKSVCPRCRATMDRESK